MAFNTLGIVPKSLTDRTFFIKQTLKPCFLHKICGNFPHFRWTHLNPVIANNKQGITVFEGLSNRILWSFWRVLNKEPDIPAIFTFPRANASKISINKDFWSWRKANFFNEYWLPTKSFLEKDINKISRQQPVWPLFPIMKSFFAFFHPLYFASSSNAYLGSYENIYSEKLYAWWI